MNSSTSTSTPLDLKANNSSLGGGFALIFVVAIGCLSVISVAALASYFCTRKKTIMDVDGINRSGGGSISPDDVDQDHSVILEMGGLDEATLNTYPKLPYSQAKAKLDLGGDDCDGDGDGDGGGSITPCCSICLAEYNQQDMLRQLPDCEHFFHAQCIDPWLKMNPSCPVCRKLPFQSPGNITEAASRENRRPFFDPWFVQLMC